MHEEKGAWTAGTVTSACVGCAPHHGTTTIPNRTTITNMDAPEGFVFHGYRVPNPTCSYDGGKIALLDIAAMNDYELWTELTNLPSLAQMARDEENIFGIRRLVIEPRPGDLVHGGTVSTPLASWFDARYNVALGEWQARHDA